MCLIGFASGLHILFAGQKDKPEYSSFFRAFVASVEILLAGFADQDTDGSINVIVTAILLLAFTYFINIVMLNLLIAIMGDIFDRIQENARAEFTFARAQIILEFEEVLSKEEKENKEWFPTWLQVLVPKLDVDDDVWIKWGGRVRSLKNSVRKVQDKLNESERLRIESAKERTAEIEGLKVEFKNQLEKSEEMRAENDKKCEAEMKKLKEVVSTKTESIENMLKALCANANMSPDDQRDRALDYESKQLMKELGVTVADLVPRPTDARSKNEALKFLKRTREDQTELKKKAVAAFESSKGSGEGKAWTQERLDASKTVGRFVLAARATWEKEASVRDLNKKRASASAALWEKAEVRGEIGKNKLREAGLKIGKFLIAKRFGKEKGA